MNQPADALPLEIDCAAVKSQLDAGGPLLLIDVREAAEIEIVAIDGVQVLPMSEITTRTAELPEDRSQHIVIMCHLGGRSLRVTEWLREQGYAQTQSMAGGIDAWAEQIDTKLARYS